MKEIKTQELCPHCNKVFILNIKTIPSKLDEKRETYYLCPYCDMPAGNILLQGNEEEQTYIIED